MCQSYEEILEMKKAMHKEENPLTSFLEDTYIS